MSKRLCTTLRPYICRDCLRQLTSSTLPHFTRRDVSTDQAARQSLDNEETVERRIRTLGGKEKLGDLYRNPKLRPEEKLHSALAFDTQFKAQWNEMTNRQKEKARVVVYGRVTAIRSHGRKLAFIELSVGGETQSIGGTAQAMLYLPELKDIYNEEDEGAAAKALKEATKRIQRGDWLAIRGQPGHSDTGSWIVRASELPTYLSPTLQTVPLLLSDPEFRMRNRHADQLVDSSSRDIIFLRQRLLTRFRQFMLDEKFIEVNTPLLVAGTGGASARPFETAATEFSDLTLNLRVAPELFLKRMIIGGMQRVFELGPAFRNEGIDNTHNPEFTIAEFYGVMLDLNDLMSLTESLFKSLSEVAQAACKVLTSVAEPEIDFAPPYPVMRFIPSLGKEIRKLLVDWKFPDLEQTDEATAYLTKTFEDLGMVLPRYPTLPKLLDGLASKFLESQCQRPTFIVHQPECMAPLARSFLKHSPTEGENVHHRVSARAELFIRGREYVNCYEEENSPFEQRRKFEEQLARRDEDEGGTRAVDESYLGALEWGLPPTGGWGCGIDRIIMLFGGKSRIADVLPFGTLRNVVGLGSAMARQKQQERAELAKHVVEATETLESLKERGVGRRPVQPKSQFRAIETRTTKRRDHPKATDEGKKTRRVNEADPGAGIHWLADVMTKEDMETEQKQKQEQEGSGLQRSAKEWAQEEEDEEELEEAPLWKPNPKRQTELRGTPISTFKNILGAGKEGSKEES